MSGLFSKETRRAIALQPGERRIVLWSGAFFFFVLASFSILRPVREQFGISAGLGRLPWLFLGTWLSMLLLNPLYGAVVSRLPRHRFIPLVYRSFMLLLILFFLGMTQLGSGAQYGIGCAFYVFVSVFNLWVVSVFWSFMADNFGSDRARRLYAWIAVGGTCGAILGGVVTWSGVEFSADEAAADRIVPYLLLVSVLMLEGAVRCMRKLNPLFEQRSGPLASATEARRSIGGGSIDGLKQVLRSSYLRRIALFLLCYTVTGTLLYFMQAEIVHGHFSSRGERTQAFAVIDLVTQTATLLVQVFVTPRLIAALGVGRTLGLLPLVAGLAFFSVALWPIFGVLIVAQGLRRSTAYAVAKPAREVLYAVVERSEKYKAKAVSDTFVYRTGDVVGGLVKLIFSPGLVGLALIAAPVVAGWAVLSLSLGRTYRARVQGDESGGSGYSPAPAGAGPGSRD